MEQTEVKYEELRDRVGKALYVQAYSNRTYRQANPWKSLEPGRKEVYLNIAMIAIGQVCGPGVWHRITTDTNKDRIAFYRDDKAVVEFTPRNLP